MQRIMPKPAPAIPLLAVEVIIAAVADALHLGVYSIRQAHETLRRAAVMGAIAVSADEKFRTVVPDAPGHITKVMVQASLEATEEILGDEINLVGVANCLPTHGAQIAARASELYASYSKTHPDHTRDETH